MQALEVLWSVQWRWPAAFALLLWPILGAVLARRRRQRVLAYADEALRPWAWAGEGAAAVGGWRTPVAWLAWALLAIALAGPRWPVHADLTPQAPAEAMHPVDVMVVLDVSASMREADVHPDRATRARLELLDLLRRLRGERLGLVVAAGQSGLLLPLTRDSALFAELLEQVGPDLLDMPGRELAAALEVARQGLSASPPRSRAVLLVSSAEREDLEGEAGAAMQAALAALAREGIPVFMLAVSEPAGADASALSVSTPDHAAWARALREGGTLAAVQQGDADWERLWDQGIARLPAPAVAPEQARTWREGFRVPLLASLFLWLVLWSPPLRGRPRVLASVLVACLTAGTALLPAPAQAQAKVSAEQQAWAAWQAGRWSQAEDLYGRLGGADGLLAAGAAALRRGDGVAAQRWSAKALMLARQPQLRTDALYNLGHAHALQGRWDAAAEAWEAVLQARPGDSAAANNLAVAQHELARRARSAPMASDLRGRRGFVAEGQVQADGSGGREPETVTLPGAGATGAQDAAGAQLGEPGPAAAASSFEPNARHLASGLAKIGRIQNARSTLLQGLVRQQRSAAPSGGQP